MRPPLIEVRGEGVETQFAGVDQGEAIQGLVALDPVTAKPIREKGPKRTIAKITRPAIRYHGAKFRLAEWVVPLLPRHRIYVEPFGGAAGVLLRKPAAAIEVYNDLDDEVVNFFRVLRTPSDCARLIAQIELTPYARSEFEGAYETSADPVERARRLCVRAQMGFGSAGATKATTGFRCGHKGNFQSRQKDWRSYPESLVAVAERLRGVLIENRPALQLMPEHDAVDTLHFVDPPYLQRVRTAPRGHKQARSYRHEMTDADHEHLLAAVKTLKGMVLLCGYATPFYDDALPGWTRLDKEVRCASGRAGSAMRTESIWLNPAAITGQLQQRLFA